MTHSFPPLASSKAGLRANDTILLPGDTRSRSLTGSFPL